MNRRDFLLLTAGLAGGCAGGCTNVSELSSGAGSQTRVVDAGPVSIFQQDGVYPNFLNSGFFVIRAEGKLIALSSYCTHRRCKLEAEPDRSFYCPCHGSTFDPTGKVTEGPAVRNLPVLATTTNSQGHLMVTVPVA